MKKNDIESLFVIFAIGTLLFIPYIGQVHLFDWDEINFAEAAREMIVTGDYLTVRIDYKPFHEKPPLFFWMQVLSMKAFGINEFAARLPNAIVGILSLMFIFLAGRKLIGYKFGLLWVLAYIGSILPFFYFKTGLIDPVFNLFMFAGVYFLFTYYDQLQNPSIKSIKYLLLAALTTGLAVLTKGPVGYLLVMLSWSIFWIIKRRDYKFPAIELVLFTLIALLPFILWFAINSTVNNVNLFNSFTDYHLRLLSTGDAGHSGPFYYHFLVLLFGCFPASVIMIRGFRKDPASSASVNLFSLFNIILLFVVLLVFSIVKTKIVHYSSLAYFPITFLAAKAMFSLEFGKLRWKATTGWILGLIGLVLAFALIAFPIVMKNIDMILPKVTDKFTNALLRADVVWTGYETVPGIIFFIGLIAAIVLLSRSSYLTGFVVLFGTVSLTVFTILPIIAPKIEPYTQGAPIEFYQSIKNNDCYVEVLGFKSYAHLFYTERRPGMSLYNNGMSGNEQRQWLLEGQIDKPVFFVCKNKTADKYLKYPQVEELYRKNGFVFMRRVVGK